MEKFDYPDHLFTFPLDVHGIKIIGYHLDIYRGIFYFVCDGGLEISVNRSENYSTILDCLVEKIKEQLKFLNPMQLEAFNSPEVLSDEDPCELDPFPVFVCQCCRDDYTP